MKTRILFLAVLATAMTFISCNNENEVLAVRLDKNKVELVKGESIQLNASVVPAQDLTAALEWFSEDEASVTVDENGKVTAVAVKRGEEDSEELIPVSVFVRYGKGADECEVTVLPLATERVEIQYPAPQVNINAGESVRLEVKCFPEDADLTDLTWSSELASVAVVDADGVVTGKSSGWSYIKASYNEKIYDEILVTVAPVAATAIKIEPATVTLPVGRKTSLKATLTPSYATDKLVWTSNDNAVIKVTDSATGAIEAVAAGTATVKVQADKVYAECVITVTE